MPYCYVRNGKLIVSDKPPKGTKPFKPMPIDVGVTEREVYESIAEDILEKAVGDQLDEVDTIFEDNRIPLLKRVKPKKELKKHDNRR
jgi:hypothetical protein